MTYKKDELRDMIPDYLNNNLPEQERLEFERSLGRFPDVERELLEFSKIKSSYAPIGDEIPSASEAVFQRVMKEISAEKKAPVVSRKAGFFDGVREFFRPVFASSRISWAVAGVQMVVILILVASIPHPDKYTTLSSGLSGVGRGKTLHIVFASETREMDIRGILNGIEGTIIDGPSSQGLYTVRINENKDMVRTLEELKKHKAVRFAEKGFDDALK